MFGNLNEQMSKLTTMQKELIKKRNVIVKDLKNPGKSVTNLNTLNLLTHQRERYSCGMVMKGRLNHLLDIIS